MTTSMAGGRNRPDPTHLTDRQQFSQALTELRERSGLTIRDVASSTGIPPATVGDYFAGRSLPPTRMRWVLDEILRQCGITDQAAVDDWQCTLSRLRRRSAADVDEPYRGLAPFESRHARHFHGRDSIIRELLARSRDPIQVLAESSGAGLSSLLRAGVLAGARRHDRWLPIGLAPGRNPCRELADQLCATLGLPTDPVDHAVHARPDLLPDLVRRALPTAHTRLVLVVDHHDDSVAFQRAINILGSHPVAGLVCGARSAGSGAVVRLPPMTADELHAVITGPALDVGVRMTTEVVDLIMRDLADRPVELALLSQLLLRLWRSRTRSGIGTAQYRASGGLPGVAARLS
ncbi:MAG TPA: helix-turn-helix transcriptional regulator, partial [Pseudonocardiaceae bacterium]|nr:helix-turn-helix transcriptional regulator [Pseudonocardiaceae bacterium]